MIIYSLVYYYPLSNRKPLITRRITKLITLDSIIYGVSKEPGYRRE